MYEINSQLWDGKLLFPISVKFVLIITYDRKNPDGTHSTVTERQTSSSFLFGNYLSRAASKASDKTAA